MTKALLTASLLVASAALGGTRFVGGGLEVGPTAPVFIPVAGPSDAVQVSQILYTQVELGFAANTHIIDVAWRKEGLGPVTGNGGCAVQVYLKNVTRQMGPFTVGSTQALSEALRDAQKVIDKPASTLPTTMGFVTLDQVENQFDFVYLGDSLEVTVVTDCRAAAAPIVDAAISWRYDAVPERVRVASGTTPDGLVLTAAPVLSSFRPHTRFRTLVETPRCEIRVGTNVLPNGGTFAVAPNHFAANVAASFGFGAFNDSTTPVTITGISFSGVTNGAAMTTATFPLTVDPGELVPTPVFFTPMTAGTLSRLTVVWATSAGSFTNTFQGTPTATPTPNPAAGLEKADGATQALMPNVAVTVQLGTVKPGHVAEQVVVASNYGQGQVEARSEVVSGDVTVVTPPTMIGSQQDVRMLTRVRAPMTRGPFTTETRVVVGGLNFVVRESGLVAEPELKVKQGSTEIANGSDELITRPSPAGFRREYTLENVGAAPLLFSPRLYWTAFMGNLPTVLGPFALAPGTSAAVAFDFPELAPTLEPFTFHTVSNDPSPVFTWTATTRLGGKGALAVSVLKVDVASTTSPISITPGQELGMVVARQLEVTIANVGDAPVTVSALGERCLGCKPRGEAAVPVTLQPGEALIRSVEFEGNGWRLEYAIESDAEGSPLSFVLSGDRPTCAVAGGPTVLALVALLLARRRAQRSRERRD